MPPMGDGIIDFEEFARRRREEEEPPRSTFAIWGGEGERTRFALPLWRAAGLAMGHRAVVAWEPAGAEADELRALVVLDLAVEPPRTAVPGDRVAGLRSASGPPALAVADDSVAVFLGEGRGRRWYLVVDDLEGAGGDEERSSALAADELFFLAGECAGLLFHRDLSGLDDV